MTWLFAGLSRVRRGGAWFRGSALACVRVACADAAGPLYLSGGGGFRLARRTP